MKKKEKALENKTETVVFGVCIVGKAIVELKLKKCL